LKKHNIKTSTPQNICGNVTIELSLICLQSRLLSLDWTLEACIVILWLSILPCLQAGERTSSAVLLLLPLIQLAVMQLTPRVWQQHRHVFIPTAQMLRCFLLLLPLRAAAAAAAAAGGDLAAPGSHSQAGGPYSSLMMLSSCVCGHLLLVLFHQQPVLAQAPLLACSTLLQGHYIISRPIQPAGLQAISLAMQASYHQLLKGMLGDVPHPGPASSITVAAAAAVPDSETSILTTALFVLLFGGLLIPLFLAYIMEWKFKVSFLLCEGPSRAARLNILTPAAAVARGNMFLAGLLYLGWLLLVAISSWVVCSTVAAVMVN
jgi:hypothetical protein